MRPTHVCWRDPLIISIVTLFLYSAKSVIWDLHILGERSSQTTLMVKAFSTTTSTTIPRTVRILCFGDSLTAGTVPLAQENAPYAPYLEKALSERQQKIQNIQYTVRHMGFPGWTSSNLLDDANGQNGLLSIVRRIQDPPLSLVILLVGTNDLGQVEPASTLAERIQALHTLCYDENIPNTIAIGIPPSAYQSINKQAAEKVRQVNQNLQSFCTTEPKANYFPFPFDFEADDERWSFDGLHFSSKGYQALGESLAPLVEDIVLRNNSGN